MGEDYEDRPGVRDNHKRRKLLPCVEGDRLSNLPESLVGLILERLPIQDAVRTSILSKKWRYRWTTMTSLVLDKQFSRKYANNGAYDHNGFIRIVNQVIILHPRPITKITLHIPQMHLDSFQEIDQWMLFLSRNGIRVLVFTNSNRPYKLPSQLSSCSKLRKLKLENCIFAPPLKFEGFPNLESLSLTKIDFRADSCGTLVNLPRLKRLTFFSCKNVHNFKINAQKLEYLFVVTYPDALLLFLRLFESPCLTRIVVRSLKPIRNFVRVEMMKLMELLSNLPKIRSFVINGHFLKLLSADNIPKWFSHAVNCLEHLSLRNIQYNDLDQLRGALCLLRNSPNLKRLSLKRTKPLVMHDDVEVASDHLESPDCLDQTLNHLLNAELKSIEGTRPEMLFIKLLLAHSPSLNKMTIQPSRTTDASRRLNIAKDVMRFPRASPKAELIYLDLDP
ncbi:hypothetical protein OSB04_013669 [Centaurea solstitialis]|uniref:F-box domain-containing protein n=1 Tax=Centaurea solstitialis TaxID=347529 RepID=A0AA38WNL3_9ASTR|nr:hypothetical protein OSB04_013669 [Centaurea solstitialis]